MTCGTRTSPRDGLQSRLHGDWMISKALRACLLLAPLLFTAACSGLAETDTVSVSIQAEYEKKTIQGAGLSTKGFAPARHCWVEGVDAQTGAQYFSGYLNSKGQGVADVPKNASFKVRLMARYEVPGKNNYGDFRMRGSVKNGAISVTYADHGAFNAIPDWSVTSENYLAERDMTVALRASDTPKTIEAGAFNIADMAVEFALKMGELEPGIGLPNLHTFWTPDNLYTDYPHATFDRQSRLLAQATGRTIFQHRVSGVGNASTEGRADEYNDSALMESFAHLLFADYGYPPIKPANPTDRIVRRDCEELAWVERQAAAESTAAFVSGFCDFVSAAFRDNPTLIDIFPEGNSLCRLDAQTAFPKAHGGEHYRQSVASALYRIWANTLGGTAAGLQTMWDATFKQGMATGTSNGNYPYGYLQCPVGNFSSYVGGLHSGVTKGAWASILAILDSESMGNPNAAFFNGGAYWKTIGIPNVSEAGTVRTYRTGRYWDFDQSQSYYFTLQKARNLKVTLEMTGDQDLFLEVFSGKGVLEESTAFSQKLAARSITLTNLKPGNYTVRIRAGYTTQDKKTGYRLTLQ